MSPRIFAGSASPNWACNSAMIWAKVRWPSQRSSTCRPVPCSLIAPSGNKITRSCSLPPQRQPAARRGRLKSSGGATLAGLDSEGPGRRPPWLNIGEVECVELRPQDVTFVAQSLDRQLLLGSCLRVVVNVVHGEQRILRRLIEPRFKIVQTSSQPGIMLTQFLHAQRDQLGGKQFRQ